MKEREGMIGLYSWRQGLRAEAEGFALTKRVISSSETKSKEEQTDEDKKSGFEMWRRVDDGLNFLSKIVAEVI